MDYVPVYAEEAESVAAQGAVVTIDASVQQNMNVVTQRVQRRDIAHEIRTVGYLGYDQERMVSVTTKYPGFHRKDLRQLHRPASPKRASRCSRSTRRSSCRPSRNCWRRCGTHADCLLRQRMLVVGPRPSSRRLASVSQYWDVSAEQIRSSRRPVRSSALCRWLAPASGVIMKRMPGLEGMATKPGMELLHIADLSNLWLTVEVFDDQLPWLDTGSSATVTLSYFPGVSYRGRVRYIEPEVSEKTRTIQLTLDVPNRDRRLRVGMYATVVFEPVAATDVITVPAESVIRTGERDIVVVAIGDGRFAPREVVLGPRGDGFIQVLEGLSDGDEVVTSAQFLIDSESNLREAIQKMIAAKRAGGAS